jgi:hypothetical protein
VPRLHYNKYICIRIKQFVVYVYGDGNEEEQGNKADNATDLTLVNESRPRIRCFLVLSRRAVLQYVRCFWHVSFSLHMIILLLLVER